MNNVSFDLNVLIFFWILFKLFYKYMPILMYINFANTLIDLVYEKKDKIQIANQTSNRGHV